MSMTQKMPYDSNHVTVILRKMKKNKQKIGTMREAYSRSTANQDQYGVIPSHNRLYRLRSTVQQSISATTTSK